ncbi:MAG: hypothetical protein ACFWUE_00080 [Xylanivirga thermophila]|jgi:hypothetical protein
MAEGGGMLTKTSYKIKPDDAFARFECTDEHANKAWSQIIRY